MAYIKAIDERRLFIELLCASLGSALGLPCPRPLLVFVRNGHYGVHTKTATLMFGSQSMAHPDVARPLRDRALILQNLRQAKLLELASVFDEWIANGDRHDGQILFGSSHGPQFIDHEQALNEFVRPVDSVKNWLVDEFIALLNDEDRNKVLQLLRTKAIQAHEINLNSDLSAGVEYLSHGAELLGELTGFLADRLPELDRLLAQRTDPHQGYLQAIS